MVNILNLQIVVNILHYIFYKLYIERLSIVFIIKFNNNFICFIQS